MAQFLAKFDTTKPESDHANLPFSDRYITGMRRYFFREWDPSMTSMLAYYVECPLLLENDEASGGSNAKISGTKNTESDDQFSTGPFTAFVLEAVFRKLHPTDLVHSASTVCGLWNRLAFSPRVWKEAVITLFESKRKRTQRYLGARNFLQKVSGSLERLAIIVQYASRRGFRVTGILPNKMPRMSHLEIEYRHRDEVVVDEHRALHFPEDFFLIDSCMPHLRCLILNRCVISSPIIGNVKFADLKFFNDRQKAFAHLECMQFEGLRSLDGRRVTVTSVEEFCWERPSLTLIRISQLIESDENVQKRVHQSLTNLRGLSFGDISLIETEKILSLSKLVFLDLSERMYSYSARELMPIRDLHHLEHLHLGDALDSEGYRLLFRAPSMPTHFPSSIKFLRICFKFLFDMDEFVDDVVASCPQLRMLGVGDKDFEYRSHGLRREGIARCFHSLRHLVGLRVPSWYDLIEALEGNLAILDDLPNRLQYIRVSEDFTSTLFSVSSVLKKFPNTIVKFNGNKIVTYRRDGKRIAIAPEVDGWRAKNAVALIQGSCCLE